MDPEARFFRAADRAGRRSTRNWAPVDRGRSRSAGTRWCLAPDTCNLAQPWFL